MSALGGGPVVVTGGSGRLGVSVANHLASRGHEVVSLDRAPSPLVDDAVRQVTVDLTDAAATAALFERLRPDGVVHLAAIAVPFSAPEDVILRTNAQLCLSVLTAAADAGTRRALVASSPTVLGYGTDEFPGFYLADSGHPAPWRVDSPGEVAAVVRAREAVGVAERAIVLANPLPPAEQLDPELHDRVLAAGLERAALEGVAGKDVTPFLLDLFHSETGGASLEANVRLVLRNAALAARVAVALAAA